MHLLLFESSGLAALQCIFKNCKSTKFHHKRKIGLCTMGLLSFVKIVNVILVRTLHGCGTIVLHSVMTNFGKKFAVVKLGVCEL